MRCKLLLIVLAVLSLSFVFAASSYENYYDLELSFNEGVISLGSLDVGFTEKLGDSFGLWSVGVFDLDGNLIDSVFFDVNDEIIFEFVDPETGLIDGSETVVLDEFSLSLQVPYYDNASKLSVFNERFDIVLVIDVSMFAKKGVLLTVDSELLTEVFDGSLEDKENVGELEVGYPISEEGNFGDIVANYWWMLAIVLVLLIVLFGKLFFGSKKSKK